MSDRYKPEQAELLQRMADEELAQAEHVEWIKRKGNYSSPTLHPPLQARFG